MMTELDEYYKENIDRIVEILKRHEDSLTDGFEFYGGEDALHKIADEIIDALPLEVI